MAKAEQSMNLKQKALIALAALFFATPVFAQDGIASVYNSGYRTASGALFNPGCVCAASKTLPLGSHVRVLNLKTHRSITVKINDRGPYVAGRIIDLTPAAASALGVRGLGRVRVAGG
jgi:rare lipoprotein A